MFDELYYRHSGRFSISGVLAGLAAGTIAAVVLSFAYAYAFLYIPIVYASFLVCTAYGAAIGFASVACMVRSNVRKSTTTKTIVNRLLLDPAQRETLRQTCSRIESKRLAALGTDTPNESTSS